MKITFEQLQDALINAGVIYMDGTKPELFNGFKDGVDLTIHLRNAVEYLNGKPPYVQLAQEAAQ